MNKKLTLSLGILLAAILLQTFALSRATLLGVSPDVVTVFLAITSVFTGQRSGMTYGSASGIIGGLLSGNIGFTMLTRTIEGFVAGYFHVPEDSHATYTQKSRMLYFAAFFASFAGNLVFNLVHNPLGEPLLYRTLVSGTVVCTMNLLITIAVNRLFLKKTLAE